MTFSQPPSRRSPTRNPSPEVFIRREWDAFTRSLPYRLRPTSPLRSLIRDSWLRSLEAGVSPEHAPLRRVSPEELQRRLTRNRQLLAAARPHLEWMAGAMGRVPHVVYLVDADGIVLESTGTDPEMMARFGLQRGYDWSEAAMGTNGAGTALATGRPVAVVGPEHYVREFRDATCTAAPIRGPGGEVIGAIDLSVGGVEGAPERLALVSHAAFSVERELVTRAAERGRAVAELAHERMEEVLERVTDGLFALDREWRFTYVNRRAEQVLGRPRETLLGESLWEALPNVRQTVSETRCRQAMETGETLEFEIYYPPLEVWLEVHTYPSANGLSVYLRDITERRRADEEKARLLERERAAREEAEGAVALRDDVLAIVSHELRNPLHTIGLRAALLEWDVSPGAREHLEVIHRSTQRMATLIQDLLDVARIEAGALRLERAAVDVRELLEEMQSGLPVARRRDRIVLRVEDDLPPVHADRKRIVQVFSNLIANAFQHGGEDVRVEIRAERRGDKVELQVSDDGRGMDSEELEHLFDRYWQAKRAKRGGSGLGLSIVQGIVEGHGSEVRVESAPDQGATFRFRLELHPGD